MERILSYVDAIREAHGSANGRRCIPWLYLGLDVDDPKAIQGTTRG